MIKTNQIKPKRQNLSIKSFDLSMSITRQQIEDLGIKGRFWSVPMSRNITLKNLTANVLCQPQSFRDIFALAGIIGIPTFKAFAEELRVKKELDEKSYEYFVRNINILEKHYVSIPTN